MRATTALFDLLTPPRCLACRARGVAPWCRACAARAARLRIAVEAVCPRCAGPPGPATCWRHPQPVARTVAAFRYRSPVSDAVVAVKVSGAHAALQPLGDHVGAAAVAAGLAADVVTWIPAEPGRARRRGFDHARSLASRVGAALGLPVTGLLLARAGIADQGRRTAGSRALPPGAFRARGRLAGARVLVVDDVLTTGATAAVAAGALTHAGATSVELAVLARAGDHRLAALPPPPR